MIANEASELQGGVPETFNEHQFRIDKTLRFSIGKFEIGDRADQLAITEDTVKERVKSILASWMLTTEHMRL